MRILLYILFIFQVLFCRSQNTTEKIKVAKETVVVTGVQEISEFSEIGPEYPGGMAALRSFITTNIKFQGDCIGPGCITVFVSFVIEKDGSVSNPKILKAPADCPQIGEDVLRVVKLMPQWKPGSTNGKPVATTFNFPIRIALK